MCIVSYFERKYYDVPTLQDTGWEAVGVVQRRRCVNVCVSRLVFSFNYGAALFLISWHMGALIYFEEGCFL